jgi:hypothetical protein
MAHLLLPCTAAGSRACQVNLVSDNARGSLVLGTNSALLLGHLNPARLERSVSFKMDQVQAHVVCSEGNPQQAPLWLQISNGKLTTPAGAESIMRQVLLPFKVRCLVCMQWPCMQRGLLVTVASSKYDTESH